MTPEEFKNLSRGDIVRGKKSGESFLVDSNYMGRATAVRTADLTNPSEWILVLRAQYEPPLLEVEKVVS